MANDFDFSLYFQFRRAMDVRESDPDLAIQLLTQGVEQAKERNNNEWRLINEHWRVQVYLNWKRDYNMANRLVVEAAINSRSPEYQEYREYVCIQNDLLLVYKGIDPVGYAPQIKEAIELTIDLTNPEMACYFCVNRGLIDYYRYVGEEEKARDQTAKFYAMTQEEPHYRIQAYEHLAYFSRKDEAWTDLLEFAKRGYELALEQDDESSWIHLKSFEALAFLKLGREEDAIHSYEIMQARVRSLKMVQGGDYYNNCMDYHVTLGDLETALSFKTEHIQTLLNSGELYWEALARIDRIKLLKQLQRNYDEDLTAVLDLCAKLKSGTSMKERLESTIAS